MKTFTKEELVELGGNFWMKNTIERVYLNRDTIINLLSLDEDNLTEFQDKALKKAKTFYSINKRAFRTDVGIVRVLFNQKGIKCLKY